MIRTFLGNLAEIPAILAALRRASKTMKAEGIDPFKVRAKCAYYTLNGRIRFGRSIAEQMTGETTEHVKTVATLIDWTFQPVEERKADWHAYYSARRPSMGEAYRKWLIELVWSSDSAAA